MKQPTNKRFDPVPLDKKWIKKQLKSDPKLKAEYDARESEYILLDELIRARIEAGLTQQALAKKMGKPQSAVGRIESTLAKKDGSVSLTTLREYASACGKTVEVRLVG